MTVDEAVTILDLLPGDKDIDREKVIKIVKMINSIPLDSTVSTSKK